MAKPSTVPIERQRTEVVAMRVTKAFKKEVEHAAAADDRTVSDWLKRLAEAALRKSRR